jgi:hypothetical protein
VLQLRVQRVLGGDLVLLGPLGRDHPLDPTGASRAERRQGHAEDEYDDQRGEGLRAGLVGFVGQAGEPSREGGDVDVVGEVAQRGLHLDRGRALVGAGPVDGGRVTGGGDDQETELLAGRVLGRDGGVHGGAGGHLVGEPRGAGGELGPLALGGGRLGERPGEHGGGLLVRGGVGHRVDGGLGRAERVLRLGEEHQGPGELGVDRLESDVLASLRYQLKANAPAMSAVTSTPDTSTPKTGRRQNKPVIGLGTRHGPAPHLLPVSPERVPGHPARWC